MPPVLNLGALHEMHGPPRRELAPRRRTLQHWPTHWKLTTDCPSYEHDERRPFNVLCPSCTSVFSTSKLINGTECGLVPSEEHHHLHASAAEFRDSVQKGCHFCNMAWTAMALAEPILMHGTSCSEISFTITADAEHGHVAHRFRISLLLNGTGPWLVKTTRYPIGPTEQWTLFLKPPTRCPDGCDAGWEQSQEYCSTGSEGHLGLARSWLDGCLDSHPCRRLTTSEFRPTRLVYVGTHSLTPYLYETSGRLSDNLPRYCALTHCWGGADDILKTTLANIDGLKQSIILADLPRTFRDAIIISRALGVEYVWIDSLCIIQDSKLDWEMEAGKMGKVYENAVVTIVAANARSAHDGCFATTNPLAINPCLVIGNPDKGLLATNSQVVNYKVPQTDAFGRRTIGQRAWTFQELYLSSRALYFGPYGVSWKCDMGEAHQHHPHGSGVWRDAGSGSIDEFPIFGPKAPDLLSSRASLDSDEGRASFLKLAAAGGKSNSRDEGFLSQCNDGWNAIVQEYSLGLLTFPDDRLEAIQGIAERIQTWTGLTYVAGLWEETLLQNLCWRTSVVIRGFRPVTWSRSGRYRAPSWSWASADGAITMKIDMNHHLSRTPPLLLQQLTGPLSLSTRTTPPKTRHAILASTETLLRMPARLERVDLDFEGRLDRYGRRGSVRDVTVRGGQFHGLVVALDHFPDSYHPSEFSEVYLLPLVARLEPSNVGKVPETRWEDVIGIAVVPTDAISTPKTFKRIGAFQIIGYEVDFKRTAWFDGSPREEIVLV